MPKEGNKVVVEEEEEEEEGVRRRRRRKMCHASSINHLSFYRHPTSQLIRSLSGSVSLSHNIFFLYLAL